MEFAPILKILSKDDVSKIHAASLDVLWEVGVKVQDNEMLKLLDTHGAVIDYPSQVARIPHNLPMEAVEKVQKRFTLYARNPKHNLKFGYGEMYFHSTGGDINYIDPIEKVRRPGTVADMVNGIKLADALPNVNMVGPLIIPENIPLKALELFIFHELIKNTSKVPWSWIYSGQAARNVLRMFSILTGGTEELKKKPMVRVGLQPISPLTFPRHLIEIMREFTKLNAPIFIGPMVQAGVSGPCTIPGTLALENAEILAGTVMVQLLNPGNPVVYAGACHIMDQRMGNISFGSPEQGLMAAAMAQIGKFHGFPVLVNVGLTDSNLPDMQAGIEKGMTLLMGALAGAEIYGNLGIIAMDQGACLEMLVIEDEIAGYIRRMLRQIEVNDETLALDVIKKVGIGGSFLTQMHTLRHLRTEFWYPSILDRRTWDRWLERGGKDLLRRAREKAKEILAKHQPEPLEKDMERELESIVESIGKEILEVR